MGRIVKIAVAIVVQVGIAYALVVFIAGPMMRGEPLPWQKVPAEGEEVVEESDVHELGALVAINEILVNVAETKGRRFFKTSLTLETEGKGVDQQAEERMPVLRGRVIDVLSSKTMDQLVEPGARDSLKTEILETLNAEVTGGQFRDLFFTEFLVQ